ncbi:hypothetical protein Nepgr_005333 [Nepenthes gracilis]|uniref:Transmembrane protein n=1 Tax=Nepenthes gracilis TaxID=150966 RepID=A0AAD3XG74_NEPGR|nr:hypothetical protein Nepgr_005333 [Nepenthes gracilis]
MGCCTVGGWGSRSVVMLHLLVHVRLWTLFGIVFALCKVVVYYLLRCSILNVFGYVALYALAVVGGEDACIPQSLPKSPNVVTIRGWFGGFLFVLDFLNMQRDPVAFDLRTAACCLAVAVAGNAFWWNCRRGWSHGCSLIPQLLQLAGVALAPNAGVLSGWISIAVLIGNGPVMLLRC